MSVLAAILVGLEIVCLHMPDPFTAIGLHYRDFHQVPDSEVVQFLDEADARRADQNGGRGTRSPQRALGDEAIGYAKGVETAGSGHAAVVATFAL